MVWRSSLVTFTSFAVFFLLTACGFCEVSARDVLDEINLARTQPQKYARLLSSETHFLSALERKALKETIRFLQKAKPLPPLSSSYGLNAAARAHVQDQGRKGSRGHAGSDGSSPGDRISRYGKWDSAVGENIYYGTGNARQIVATLIIDAGVWNRGHRKNIFQDAYTTAGIALGSHPRFGGMCVIDFAGEFSSSSSRHRSSGKSFRQRPRIFANPYF